MSHRFGWIVFALLLPLVLMAWGILVLANGRLGWTVMAIFLTILATSTILEVRSQEHLAGKLSLSGEGRQHILAGLWDAAATFAGSLVAVGFLLLIVMVLLFLRGVGL